MYLDFPGELDFEQGSGAAVGIISAEKIPA
jgi:hypothetical protein